jgi:hypothetical protein
MVEYEYYYDGIPTSVEIEPEDVIVGDVVTDVELVVTDVVCLSDDNDDVAYIKANRDDVAKEALASFQDLTYELDNGI